MYYIKNYFKKLNLLFNDINFDDVENISKEILNCKKKGNSVFIFGNGGSASIASHVSTDLNKICKVKSKNFNEANHITCFANDFGYERWVVETLKIYLKKNDLVILISSKGNSKNMINAAKFCNKKGVKLITLTGFDKKNKLKSLNKSKKLNVWINSKTYNFVENLHQIILLAAIDKISKSKF